MDATICKAISDRTLLGFTYKGMQRWVESHAYGLQFNGNEALCAWQVAGGSGGGFRLFVTAEMTGLSLGDSFDGPRDGYHPGDRRFQVIYAEL